MPSTPHLPTACFKAAVVMPSAKFEAFTIGAAGRLPPGHTMPVTGSMPGGITGRTGLGGGGGGTN